MQISVIIPTYHRNELLAKCLDCLAPNVQTLPANQYEVIVTDDGSNSSAEHMILDQYPWVRWVAGPHKGPAANRNNGAKYANGKWLAFTDDDCLPSTGWLEAFVNALTPDYQVYEGKTTCEEGIKSLLYCAPVNETGGMLWSCNMMLTKSVFKEMGGFDEAFPYPHLEDTDFRERIEKQRSYFFVGNAVIDHPPRRIPDVRRLAEFHESEIYFWYKQGHKERFSKSRMLYELITFRLKRLIKSRPSVDWFYAIWELIIEVWYLTPQINIWNDKYQCIFGPKRLTTK